MLKIRFQRVGKKNQPKFRLVAIDSRFGPKSGKAKEVLGWWDPLKKVGEFNKERIDYWLSCGAQVSDTAWNLLIKKGIIKGQKRKIKISPKKEKK
jgi:small subunit ribosomal protein S16